MGHRAGTRGWALGLTASQPSKHSAATVFRALSTCALQLPPPPATHQMFSLLRPSGRPAKMKVGHQAWVPWPFGRDLVRQGGVHRVALI